MPRCAFTLIELTVAMALGLMVALVAYAGFQVAGKSFSAARQLSSENLALVEGYRAATDEADFWFACDDFGDPAGRQQRVGYDVNNRSPTALGGDCVLGQPFAPMAVPAPYWNWNFADSQLWPRAGFFNVFFPSTKYSFGANPAQLSHITHPNPEARMLNVIQDRLFSSLGWAGYLHYNPGHLSVTYRLGKDPSGSVGRGVNSFGNFIEVYNIRDWDNRNPGLPRLLFDATRIDAMHGLGHERSFKNVGRFGLFVGGQTSFLAPRDGWNADPTKVAGYINAAKGSVVPLWIPAEWTDAVATQIARNPWAKVGSAHDSTLSVKITRKMGSYSPFRTHLYVEVTNPDNGNRFQIVYQVPATTLRGARQQRQWAHRGSATMDRILP